jgi:excinuclease ABC subunit B
LQYSMQTRRAFLRSARSLTQTAGRAARNLNGKVIMYADRVTESMQETINETNRRRAKQLKYNEEMGITPAQIVRKAGSALSGLGRKGKAARPYIEPDKPDVAADPVVKYMNHEALEKAIEKSRKSMEKAASELDFIEAARFRDEMAQLQGLLRSRM